MGTRNIVYLDCHSTTPIDELVCDVVDNANRQLFGNPATNTHSYGRFAEEAVSASRLQIANTIRATKQTVYFCSSATEANNLVLRGALHRASPKMHIVTTSCEHKAILDPALALEAEDCRCTIVDSNEAGQVNVDEIANAITDETVLVSAIFANNEVGTLNSVAKIGAVCRNRGVLFHTDATQAVGKIAIDVTKLPIDLMSFSAHKIYGPKGIGALYIRNNEVKRRLRPLMYGGGQENRLRSGTLPVPLIVGFGKACELCQQRMEEDSQKIGAMRDRLWERFESEIPNVILNGHLTERLYNNLNVSFLGVPSEAFMIRLRDVVAVSAGSACTSASPEPSHVLRAMKVGHERLESAIRFGLGRFNTMEEIEYVADHVRDAVAELRRHLQSGLTIEEVNNGRA